MLRVITSNVLRVRGNTMSKFEVPRGKYNDGDHVKVTDVLDLSLCKPIGQIVAEELDQAIAREFVVVLKKYLPNSQIDEERVLKFAKMFSAIENNRAEEQFDSHQTNRENLSKKTILNNLKIFTMKEDKNK